MKSITEKTLYLDRVKTALSDLEKATDALVYLWNTDDDYGIDLNNFLTEGFPFDKSLDEHAAEFGKWREEATERLDEQQSEIKNSAVFSAGYDTLDPKEAMRVSDADFDEVEEGSEVLVCQLTGLWIEKRADGNFSVNAANGSEYGTFEACVKYLRECHLL